MCGLVGMAGDLDFQDRTKIFKDMLTVSQLRGRDSTGVFAVDDANVYDFCKQLGSPESLISSRNYERVVEDNFSSKIVVGHTRHKTVGNVSLVNAHPFDFPDRMLIGVHNGTLTNPAGSYGKTDSERLYELLAEAYTKEEVLKVLKDVHGAYALIWWDGLDETLNFVRNDQRPLNFAYSEDLKQMYWVSEKWMLGSVARHRKLTSKSEFIFSLPVHTLWSVQVSKSKTEIKEVCQEKFEPVPKVSTYVGYGYGVTNNTPPSSSTFQGKGGEVTNPFLPSPVARIGKVTPKNHKTNETSGSSISTLSKSDTTKSDTSTKVLTDSTTGTAKEKNNITGVLATISKAFRTNSKKDSSNDSKLSSTLSKPPFSPVTKPLVSSRVVAGEVYLTDTDSGYEWSFRELLNATGGVCSMCSTRFNSYADVGLILDERTVVCKSCLNEEESSCAEPASASSLTYVH